MGNEGEDYLGEESTPSVPDNLGSFFLLKVACFVRASLFFFFFFFFFVQLGFTIVEERLSGTMVSANHQRVSGDKGMC